MSAASLNGSVQQGWHVHSGLSVRQIQHASERTRVLTLARRGGRVRILEVVQCESARYAQKMCKATGVMAVAAYTGFPSPTEGSQASCEFLSTGELSMKNSHWVGRG